MGVHYLPRIAIGALVAIAQLNADAVVRAEEPESQGSPPSVLSAEEQATITTLPVVPPGLNGSYSLDIRPAKKVSALYTYTVHAPNLAATEWLLFIPRPPDLPCQKIFDAKTLPPSTVVPELSPNSQPLFQAKVPVGAESLKQQIELQLLVDAGLFSRKLVLGRLRKSANDQLGQLVGDQRLLALRPTTHFDYTNNQVQTWIARSKIGGRGANEGEINFARRVFQTIAKSFQYEYTSQQDRRASNVCVTGKSDCGGLSALFIAVLRSQGIPARLLIGRWATSAVPGQRMGEVDYYQQHAKAEFFAQGVGWVPADLSSAVLHDKSPQRLQYFGNDAGDFLVIHLDADLVLDTLNFGKKTMDFLQSASYWATGSGSFDGVIVREGWLVR